MNLTAFVKGVRMKNKHIGFVVEQEIYDRLHEIAKDEYRSISMLLYVIVKKWLKRYSSKKKKESD